MSDYPKEFKDALKRDLKISIGEDKEKLRAKDTRYTYGASCTWNGSIHEVGNTQPINGHSLPCCPYCGGMLFEVPSKKEWDEGVEKYNITHPGYKGMIEWHNKQKKCFSTFVGLMEEYEIATGIKVKR